MSNVPADGSRTRLLDQLQPILCRLPARSRGAAWAVGGYWEDRVYVNDGGPGPLWARGHRSSGKRAPRRPLPMLSRRLCAQRDQMQAAARGLEDAGQGSVGRVARHVRSRKRAISSSQGAVPLCRPPGWRGRELWRSLQLAGWLERVQTRQRQRRWARQGAPLCPRRRVRAARSPLVDHMIGPSRSGPSCPASTRPNRCLRQPRPGHKKEGYVAGGSGLTRGCGAENGLHSSLLVPGGDLLRAARHQLAL